MIDERLQRCIRAYQSTLPNLGEGQGRDKIAYIFAAFMVRDKGLSIDEALPFLEEWDAGNTPPKGRECLAAIAANARKYGRRPVGSGLNGEHQHDSTGLAAGLAGSAAKETTPTFELPPLTLRLASARKTKSGRLTATVIVQRDGQAIDQLVLTSSSTGRREAVRRVAEHLGDADEAKRSEIDRLLGRVLVAAEGKAGSTSAREGNLLRGIVGPRLLADFKFVYRTGAVAYSETRGEVRRQEFITHAPSDLMDAAAEATDAPINEQGMPVRSALSKAIQVEAGVVWSDLMRSLPLQADADLAADTETAKQFRALFKRVWTTPGTWEQDAGGGARRASLASRALEQIRTQEHNAARGRATRSWQQILNSVHAWWRIYVSPDGEVFRLLAMRYDLAFQILKTELPGVSDQPTLTRLGVQFGMLDPKPPLNTRRMRGRERLAVLSREVTDQLLEYASDLEDGREPGEDDAEGHDDTARRDDTSSSASLRRDTAGLRDGVLRRL